ncbi:single-stranded DNA-binding protein [Pseudomonas sp. FME51]|uniref:single-stranded DNA-binding protein n=1 Tax=Pseudomonas sp. FME51 TaxID=2742609 RepID=UPI001868DE43|nr:single-stranded DNA-binding protein [Pseudomonas sp. FME51]
MKLIFEIHSTFVNERTGKSARTGNDYKLREQEAWVQIGDAPYPQKTKVMLDEGQAAYAPGKYMLHERSFSIGKYDSLQCQPFLVPLAAQVQKTA